MTADLDKRLAGLSPEKRALLEKKLKQVAAKKTMDKVRKQHIPPRQGSGPWPASMDQTAFWFFHQMDPDFYAYNNGPTLRVEGPLNIATLEAAASELLRRHEILRTIFRYENDQLYQVPVKDPAVTCHLIDLSNEPEATRLERAHQEVTRLFRQPFDMTVFPLIRFNLIKLADEDFLMPLVAHHAIIDWWTLKLIPKELLTIYYALVKGLPSPLPELPVQFIDYTIWRNNWLQSNDFDKQLNYWMDKLKGAPLVLDLPKDRPRPAQQDFTGERLYRRMSPQLLEGIRKVNIRLNASSLMTCMAGTFAFLSRYSGQRDLLIGTPTTDRERKELENMAGYMLNVLIIRADLTEDPTFAEFVGQMKRTVLDALANKELPFRMLVEKLSPQRNLSHMPIYQVDFNHVAIDGPVFETFKKQSAGIEMPGYDIGGFPMERGISDVDLQVNFDEGLDEGRIVMEWAAALFDTPTAEHMGDLLVRLFTNLTANPDIPISRVSWLSDEEREQLLVTWNGSTPAYPRDRDLGSLIADSARTYAEETALVHGSDTWTYAQLSGQADRIAAYLVDQGVGIGDPVGLALKQGFDWVAAMLGILRAGGAYVPLDSTYPQERIAYMLEDTGMTILITHSNLIDALPAHQLNFLNLLVLDEDAEMLDAYTEAPAVTVPAEAPAYIIYTSGTTGKPKGVVVPHRAVSRLVHDTEYVMVEPGSGVAQASNISFDAHVFEVFTPLVHGARICVVEKDTFLNAEALAAQIAEQRIDTLFMTTALFNQHAREKRDLFVGLKHLLFGGERVDPEAARHVLEAGAPQRLLHVYGPTEACTYATWHLIDAVAEDAHNIPIGGPIANTRAYVLDKGHELAPVGVVGELCIAGDALAHGYHGDPAKTALKFTPNPNPTEGNVGDRIYRTGDLVRRRRDGALDFYGRVDNQVKLRGFRIELGEIETALTHHEAISEAVAIVRTDANRVKRIYAYICPEKDAGTASIDVAAVRTYLGGTLPEYMLPAALVVLETFPLTPNGKVDTKALPDPNFQAEVATFTGPRNDVEAKLCAIWCAQLNLEQVGVHDNFFELGGDSILGIQTIAAANRAGLPLSTKHLFQFQTIEELAEQVGTVAAIVAEQGTVTGDVPLTPIQSWFLNRGRRSPHHFNIGMHLEVNGTLDAGILQKALDRLVAHHDALRMRFRQVDGVWTQINEGLEGRHYGFTQADFSGEPDPVQALIALADTKQSALDLGEGPLVQVILGDLGADLKQRLIVIVHHLVFDGISSRVLMEDLGGIYQALAQKQEPKMMPKTTSWQYWAKRMNEFARSDKMLAEIPWWESQVKGPAAVIPFNEGADNSAGTTKSIYVGLDEDETRKLLQEVPAAYNTRINDLLLCSLAMAVADRTGTERVRIALEGHGREELFDDVDFSRTFGWFTAMYPVMLDMQGANDDGSALKTVKEQIRKIPHNGLGYGLLRWVNPDVGEQLAYDSYPQLNINYLGQFGGGGGGGGESLLDFSTDVAGREHAPNDQRGYHFEIVGVTVKDRLNLFYNYSSEVIDEAVAQDLADRHIAKLRQLIEHCLQPGTGGRTPSDFPHVTLSQQRVDSLLTAYPNLEAIFPATGLQSGMLFHSLMAPESTVYRQQLYIFLPGKMDVEKYQKAWQRVIDRHESLRTLFVEGDKGFLQVVLKDFKPEWIVGQVQNRDEIKGILQERLNAPQVLDKAPASRFAIYRYADEGVYFVWDHHHVNLDGWSLPLVMEEVSGTYQAFLQGVEPELPNRISYATYVDWYVGQDRDKAEAHWRNLLQGFDQPTLLAVNPPQKDTPARVETIEHLLSKEAGDAVEQFARANGLTMSTLFQAAWALTLGRYLDREDVAFGVTGSGRPPEVSGVENLVGMFLNTLPLRTRLEGDQVILAWLESIQNAQVEGRQYEYSILADIQRLADTESGQSLFDSIVVYENYPVDTSLGERFGGGGMAELDLYEESNFPITLQSGPGTRVMLRLRYDATRFEDAYIQGLIHHLAHILAAIPENATGKLGDLQLLTPDQIQTVSALAGETADYPSELSLGDQFHALAVANPDQPAITVNGQHTTYGELSKRANRIAHALRAMGVCTGSHVAVSMDEEDAAFIAAFLGVLTAGAVYVPLDATLPDARLDVILTDAAPVCLIGDLAYDHGLPTLDWKTVSSQSDAQPEKTVDAGQPAYIMYTSGSTGVPKGVVATHRGVTRLVRGASYLSIGSDDVVLQNSVPHFDAATFEIWGALLNGARLVLMSSQEIQQIPKLVASEGVTVLHLTAQLFNLMVDNGLEGAGSLRVVLTGGDAASASHIHRFREMLPDLPLIHCYGPTENTTFTTNFDLSTYGGDDTPIGSPVSNSTVRILDHRLRLMPTGVMGELTTGGDGLALGYLNSPALTAENFIPDPYGTVPGGRLYRTGDLAVMDEDGVLRFHGRRDHQVKIRGFRIEPDEVAAHLLALPDVSDVLVRVKTLAAGDKRLLAWVVQDVAEDKQDDRAKELRTALGRTLPDYMVPAGIAVVPSLPMKASGKVDMAALPDPLHQEVEFTAPQTPTQETVAAIWSELLDVSRISIHANVFEMGAHSLTATRATALLRESFAIDLPIKALFESPTTAKLATYIDLVLLSRQDDAEDLDMGDDVMEGEI